RDVLRVLTALSSVQADQNLSPKEMIDQVVEAAKESSDERLKNGPWDTIRNDLVRLLSLERSLGVSSKALFIASQCQRHFHDARVLTDARPVFTSDPSQPPAAFIILHTLQLSVNDDGEDTDWYVVLDRNDLRKLRNVIERALQKEQ